MPAATAATGASTKIGRGQANRARSRGSPSALTRSRTSCGACGLESRSLRMRSSCEDMWAHLLLELLQGAREAGRARRRADPEHARGGLAVEVEDDAERDHLALGGREAAHGVLEVGRQALDEPRLLDVSFANGVDVFATTAALLCAEVVERSRARDLAQPRLRAAAARVEAPPRAESPLERLGCQVFGQASL